MSDDRFSEPKGFAWGGFMNAAGANIRYGHAMPEGEPKGTVVVLPGFREPIEKYFEVIQERLAAGYEVYAMDWRGQGGSDRQLADPMKAHSKGYGEQVETLHRFMETVVGKKDKPVFMLAHSMGAHIGLRYLHDHEGVFAAAVLTAPMMDIQTGVLIPKPLARRMAQFARIGGTLEKYRPGGGPWTEAHDVFEGNDKTSDPARFHVQTEAFLKNPKLQVGDPTYGWVYHTFESIDVLNREDYLKSIKTPILMEISGDDKIVEKKASERAASLLPDCIRVDIPAAKHEIWMERDELRAPFVARTDAFLENHLQGASPRPKKQGPHRAQRPPGPG